MISLPIRASALVKGRGTISLSHVLKALYFSSLTTAGTMGAPVFWARNMTPFWTL